MRHLVFCVCLWKAASFSMCCWFSNTELPASSPIAHARTKVLQYTYWRHTTAFLRLGTPDSQPFSSMPAPLLNRPYPREVWTCCCRPWGGAGGRRQSAASGLTWEQECWGHIFGHSGHVCEWPWKHHWFWGYKYTCACRPVHKYRILEEGGLAGLVRPCAYVGTPERSSKFRKVCLWSSKWNWPLGLLAVVCVHPLTRGCFSGGRGEPRPGSVT